MQQAWRKGAVWRPMTDEHLQRGIELLNAQQFFDAHEELENAWRAAPPDYKLFYQSLVQVAVAMHHCSKGNLRGGRSVLDRAVRNLVASARASAGFDASGLHEQLVVWQSALANGGEFPPWPQVRMTV
ncbi:MAG TPA: DUF309 domain-containing protein [Clostridia bacterium]|nr:DUF309 domain-containing protein [Clostridia bacterium]